MWRVVRGRLVNPERIPALKVDAQGDPQHCRIAAIELSLDYVTKVQRFYLRPPAGRGADRREQCIAFVKAWRDITIAEKGSQFEMLAHSHGTWPELPMEWGTVASVDLMPCVLWVHIAAHDHQ